MVRPYRPCPPDFRARFMEMGWDGIDEHYHTNWRVIRRWIEEAGGEDLRAERRRVSGGSARPVLRAEFRRETHETGVLSRAQRKARKKASQPRPQPSLPIIDAKQARRRYAELHGSTELQRRAWIKRSVLGDARVHQAIILAKDEFTLDQAAEAIGVKPASLRGLLYRKLGSASWPPDISSNTSEGAAPAG